jgi:hypothetical protein
MTSANPTSRIDPRGPRFGAGITAVILVLVLILGPGAGLPLLIVQLLAFAAGAIALRYQPWGLVFKHLVRPRLQPPTELEDEAPPRFAQLVGLLFAVAGVLGAVFGAPIVFFVAVGFALIAALLNAVFDFCLGCEVYLLGRRLLGRARVATS